MDELLEKERGVLEVYLSGHPLEKYRPQLDRFMVASIAKIIENISGVKAGDKLRLAGVIIEKAIKRTRKKERMAVLMMEDLTGLYRVVVFPELYKQVVELLEGHEPLAITGTIKIESTEAEEGDSVEIFAEEIYPLCALRERMMTELRLRLSARLLDDQQLGILHDVIKSYPGNCMLTLQLEQLSENGIASVLIEAGDEFRVSPSEALIARLEELPLILGIIEQ